MTSKCGKNKKVAHKAQLSVSLMFLPHFDVLCDLLLNRRTATWNLFVLYNKELKKVLMMTSSMRLSSNRSSVRTNQNVCITELII